MLTLKSVHSYYGRLHVLKGVSLHVRPGEIVTLLGANGAGKTTALRTISGLLRPRKGKIEFLGEDISRLSADQIVLRGIAHVPEGRRVFSSLSVAANLELGAFARHDHKSVRADLEDIQRRFPILKERSKQPAGTLSGGEQQILAIARALMARPKLLLLDEPSMGLAPRLVRHVFEIIVGLQKTGATILLIEQNARAALKVADRGYVMETGGISLDGSAADLMNHNEVKRAYLGKGYQEVWE
ncbi:MAG TPA: branched-chain amino acid ABC transporter ATP-binding protein [Desulfobacterales bacterium]|nr:branched-chain amino acid ABC transporter ATP-binding protein [Desulfobacterales bacterium]